MTKRELIMRISKKTGIVQVDTFAIIQQFLDSIVNGLAEGEHFEFRKFGTFKVDMAKPRTGRNPRKPEQVVHIPAHKKINFIPSKDMKKAVAAKHI